VDTRIPVLFSLSFTRQVRPARVCSILAALLALGFLAPSVQADDSRGPTVIAVVRDGPNPGTDLVPLVEQELAGHLRPGTSVRFKSGFEGDWSLAGARHALERALADAEVDLVLLTGPLATHEAIGLAELAKPVIGSFIAHLAMFPDPIDGDRSAKDNLSFTTLGRRVQRDLEEFRRMIPFTTLHVAVSREEIKYLPAISRRLAELESLLGIEIAIVEISPDVDDSLSRFGSGVQAVYLTGLPRLSESSRRHLIAELNARQLPTFSMRGVPDVEAGVLASVTPDMTLPTIRRAALNLSRVIRGETTADLPVLMSVDTALVLNGATAVRIGWVPDQSTALRAELIAAEALDLDQRLLLAEAFELAEGGNTALTVSDAFVEGAESDQYRVRSALLPQLLADLSYEKADVRDFGDGQAVRGGLVLRQLLYDDGVWGDYKSSKRLHESSVLGREADRLQVLGTTGRAFVSLALAQALLRVQSDNLQLTRDNLELARLRREVGYSGREEVLRWESQLAQDQGALLLAESDVQTARISLNQVLGQDQQRRWLPEVADVDADVFPFVDRSFDDLFEDLIARRALREALVDYALGAEPELQAQGKTIEAQDIQVSQLRRRYYVPLVFADLGWSDALSGSGEPLVVPQGENYSIRVGASYSIFEGGRRKYDLRRARSDLSGLERTQQFQRELVEQDVRTAMRRCESSFPRISFTRVSAERAAENLELVRDRYAEGLVNVTDLLDAQNQNLVTDQLATAAVYEFRLDLIDLQRAIAWFEDDKTDDERRLFVEEIRSVVAAAGRGEVQP
jgi:outer membrane protein TolC